MSSDLKQDLVNRLKQVGAYDVRIADPRTGFEHSLERMHPLELWEQCRSVIIFAVASSPKNNNTYIGPYAPWQGSRPLGPIPRFFQSDDHAIDRVAYMMTASITLKGINFLSTNGYNASLRYHAQSMPNLKLAAFEAGMGVYGRSGLIIHPVIGNRTALGGILTDAVLEPDGHLEDFEPCADCAICIEMCPAKAFDSKKSYPGSFSREKCTAQRARIEDTMLYCHNCWAACPAGKLKDEELLSIREAKSFFKPQQQ